MRRSDRASNATLPLTAFHKVIDQHRDQFVGINEFTTFIENAEAIRVAVRCHTQLQRVLLHYKLEFAELFIGGFRMMTTEKNVAVGVEKNCGDVLALQQRVKVSRAWSLER